MEIQVKTGVQIDASKTVGKLDLLLSTGIATEAHALQLMVLVRKLLELQNAKRRYEYLTFHCDWALHSKLEGTTTQKILRLFDAANGYLKAGVEPDIIYNPTGGPMKNMSAVVQQLKKEREHVHQQLQRIDEALEALGSVRSNGASRTISAAGRRRISLAQKARWAKQKAKPKRTISAAGRKRVARAQRARWAKVKSAA